MIALKSDHELMAELLAAKQSGDKSRIRNAVIEMLRPEAGQVVDLARKDITTKDGYGTVMRACIKAKEYKHVLLEACVREGFPAETADTVKQLI